MKIAFIAFVLLTIIASCNSVSAQHWSWMNSLNSGSSNNPGNRSGAFSWTGQDNKLYLFGGSGNNAQGVNVRYNDLWSYDTASAEWTLLGGSEVADAPGIYGQLGVTDANNWPGSRELGAAWADGSGNLWLFGGLGFGASNQSWWLNDLWKYDIASGLWTWVGGSDGVNSLGSYGQIGIGLESNVPAARHLCTYWQNNDDFYVMGGIGTGASVPGGYLNDLWKFSTETGVWTLLSGDNQSIYYPNYGEQNIPSIENNPGSRFGASGWISDNGDTLFLFGGGNFNSEIIFYNDLWQFDIPTLTWTWISGPNAPQNQGEYGEQGVASIANNPPARIASVSFHHNDYLWLFGGTSFEGYLNDLWKLNKTTREWTWVSGSNSVNDPGAYIEENPDYPFNYPSSRNYAASWTISETENWIYGGTGNEPFDDLWVLDLVGVYSYFLDSDGDGYGDPAFEIQSSTPVQGYVLNSEDCCDSNANINPGGSWWGDMDVDGVGSFIYDVGCMAGISCSADTWPAQLIPYYPQANNNEPYIADCNDNDPTVFVGASCDDSNTFTINDEIDGSCTCIGTPITGCTDPLASNYNPLATINEGCGYIAPGDTLFCNQITTPAGPGQDWGLWLNGLYSAGLASTDWFRWSGFPSLAFGNDGSAHLVGDVVANNNLSNGWHVDITLEEGADWSTWSAGGGLYMDMLGLNDTTHTSWSFYKLIAGESRLEGFGALDGDLLFLTHQPLNYSYGWQFGMGANNRNSNNGGSGWFFYSGIVNGTEVSGHGDVTLDMACNYPESYSLNIFVYNDLNGNGAHDIDEPGLSNWPVMGNSIDGLLWTNNNGYYYLTLDTAQYEFTLLNTNDNWVSTTPMNVTIDLTSGPAIASFGLQVVPGEAIIGASPFTGFWDILHCTQGYESGVYLENIGSQAVSGFMTLTCDPLFTPNADSYFTSPPVEVGPGYALWNVEDFLPGEYELLSFHIDGPGVEYLNQSFTFAFDLTLFDPQGNMIYSDNWSVSPIVACAYDPNDITGFPEGLSAPHEEGYTIEHFILPDNMVEFRVRFQNTGTLPAEDIDIYIPLDPNQWDLSTIFPLMRSAEMQVVCLHDDGTVDLVLLEHELPEGVTAQDLLIFSFDDIYLPDSASNPDGSQGYVYFRMQAKHTLNIGDEINAQAFIYFEQNPAVVTNETYHVIFDCTSFTPMVGDTELCAGEALQFSASQPNVDDYSWNIGSLEGSGNIFLFEGIDAGEYTLELNTSNMLCPQGEDHQVNVIVHDIPQLDVPLDATVCEGEELTYEAESDGGVSWTNGASTGDVFTAEESFTVTATAIGAGGCSTSADWTVTVNPLPSAEVDSANFVLTAADGVAWQWSVNGVLDATTQSINATENGNYQVEITSEFGCVAMSDVVAVELPIPDNVFVHSWSTLALFPNPMTTSARLELPQGAFDIALYDLTGACVRAMSKQQGTVLIERESLARGVYQVRISNSNYNRSIRLVIE